MKKNDWCKIVHHGFGRYCNFSVYETSVCELSLIRATLISVLPYERIFSSQTDTVISRYTRFRFVIFRLYKLHMFFFFHVTSQFFLSQTDVVIYRYMKAWFVNFRLLELHKLMFFHSVCEFSLMRATHISVFFTLRANFFFHSQTDLCSWFRFPAFIGS